MSARALLTLGMIASIAAAPAAAQVAGIPVVNNGAPSGLSVGADVGVPNEAYGKGTAIEGRAQIGFGFFGVAGMISHYSPKGGGGFWSPGFNATLRLLGGPLVPFRITLQGGVGHWSEGGAHFTHIPISVGFSATIPNPAFAIKPWIAPRLDVMKYNGGIPSDSRFGISGGVDLALLSGVMIRAAYDRRSQENGNPSVLSFGLGFTP
ncbi:MAG: hypothetical protein ACREL5_12560 [Gemmatimonadales bacterium]